MPIRPSPMRTITRRAFCLMHSRYAICHGATENTEKSLGFFAQRLRVSVAGLLNIRDSETRRGEEARKVGTGVGEGAAFGTV